MSELMLKMDDVERLYKINNVKMKKKLDLEEIKLMLLAEYELNIVDMRFAIEGHILISRWKIFTFHQFLFYAFQIISVFGVYFNFVTCFNKKRNHYSGAGFYDGVFQGVGCSISFHSRICFNYIQINRWWDFC